MLVTAGGGHVGATTIAPGDTGLFGLKKKWKKAKRKARSVSRSIKKTASHATRTVSRAAKRTTTRVTRTKAFRASVDPRRLAPKSLRKSKYFAVAAPERLAPKRVRKFALYRAATDPNALSDKRVQQGLNRARQRYGSTALRVVATGASFVPGVGTGIAAGASALAAANEGKSLSEILEDAAIGAIPGGPAAQIAAQTAVNMARGGNLSDAAIAAARERVPGGVAGKVAFDTVVGAAKGQRIDRAAKAAGFRAARENIGGGALGQAAVSTLEAASRGQRLDRAARDAATRTARQHLPGGALGKAALHTALGVSRGQKPGRALIASGSRLARAELERAGRDRLRKAAPMSGKVLRLADANPLGTGKRRPQTLSRTSPSVLRAERALRKRPELSIVSSQKAARTLGLPLASVQKALRRTGPALPWKSLSRPAAALVARHARAATPYILSRFDTRGLAADGLTYTVEPNDYGVKIAQKLVGDGNRWRELRSANPQIASRRDPNNTGFVIYPGDVLQLPESWVEVPPAAVSAAAILQAKATLAAWGLTDGAGAAGVSDYGQRPEDLSPTWGARDSLELASFSTWSNANEGTSLPTTGNLTQAHADALQLWAESRAGTLPAPPSGGLPALPTPTEPPSMPPDVPPLPGITPTPTPAPVEPPPSAGPMPGLPPLPGLPTPTMPEPVTPPPAGAEPPPPTQAPASGGEDLLPAVGIALLLAKLAFF